MLCPCIPSGANRSPRRRRSYRQGKFHSVEVDPFIGGAARIVGQFDPATGPGDDRRAGDSQGDRRVRGRGSRYRFGDSRTA